MANDDEDDYLSDKFLLEAAPASAPKTYSQLRKEVRKQSELKKEQNRKKSRREQELESRQEGLSKSLFEREEEEKAMGLSKGNKALGIMLKMGFQPGQSLGKPQEAGWQRPGLEPSNSSEASSSSTTATVAASTSASANSNGSRASISVGFSGAGSSDADTAFMEAGSGPASKKGIGGNAGIGFATESLTMPTVTRHDYTHAHVKAPIPLNEWQGKREAGIGIRKRPLSPASQQLVAKMAKLAESKGHESFRDHAREQYLERCAAGRLEPVQRTCVALDEKAGKAFNVLWLNPTVEHSFPPGLLDLMNMQGDTDTAATPTELPSSSISSGVRQPQTTAQRLRQQMQRDVLTSSSRHCDDDDDEVDIHDPGDDVVLDTFSPTTFSRENVEQAVQFLRLNAQDRLDLVLSYLRNTYWYCFWCGTQYEDGEKMEADCPGETEDDHD